MGRLCVEHAVVVAFAASSSAAAKVCNVGHLPTADDEDLRVELLRGEGRDQVIAWLVCVCALRLAEATVRSSLKIMEELSGRGLISARLTVPCIFFKFTFSRCEGRLANQRGAGGGGGGAWPERSSLGSDLCIHELGEGGSASACRWIRGLVGMRNCRFSERPWEGAPYLVRWPTCCASCRSLAGKEILPVQDGGGRESELVGRCR